MNQHSAPILEALAKVERRPPAGFGAPGHAGGKAVTRDVLALVGRRAFQADILTPKGLDDRSEHGQVVQHAHALAADAWGADLCRFSTGGSTQSLHTALASVARPGETVILAQNCHKAEFSAAVFGGLDIKVLPVTVDAAWDVEHGADPAALEALLATTPHAKAVVVVSPTYFGVTSDIAALAEACHRHGAPLIVDAAWGAAFGFCRRLPKNPMAQGADVAVCSVHKTMGALAQGSVMLLKGDRVDPRRFALAYELFETTSPSVAVMASLDATRREHALHGEAVWSRVLRRTRSARRRLTALPGVRVMGREVLGVPGAEDLDETKVLMEITDLGITGYEADDWMQRHHRVSIGLSDSRRLLAVFGVGTTGADVRQLLDAVEALAAHRQGAKPTKAFAASQAAPRLGQLGVELAMDCARAFAAETEMVAYDKAAGRVAAEIVAPAPPGVPRLIPGQRIAAAHIDFLKRNADAGVFLLDPADPHGRKVRVVCEAAEA